MRWLSGTLRIGLVLAILLLLFTPITHAQENNSQNIRIVVEEGQTIDSDYVNAGDTLEIYGTINGDLYAAAGDVLIAGTVNGDVLIAGGNLRITGTVEEDVRAVGGNIDISGVVDGNVSVVAGNINIADNADLGGTLALVGGNSYVSAPVTEDLYAAVGNLVLADIVNGDAHVAIGELRMVPGARITGDLNITSPNQIVINNEQVGGSVNYNIVEQPDRTDDDGIWTGVNFGLTLAWAITSLIIGSVLMALAPRIFDNINGSLRRTWLSLGIGLAAIILIPFAAILFFITIIGIPLGLILIFVYLLIIYIAPIVIAYWIGRYVLTRSNYSSRNIAYLAIGIVIYSILSLIPIIGPLIKLTAAIFGTGAILLTIFNSGRKHLEENPALV